MLWAGSRQYYFDDVVDRLTKLTCKGVCMNTKTKSCNCYDGHQVEDYSARLDQFTAVKLINALVEQAHRQTAKQKKLKDLDISANELVLLTDTQL